MLETKLWVCTLRHPAVRLLIDRNCHKSLAHLLMTERASGQSGANSRVMRWHSGGIPGALIYSRQHRREVAATTQAQWPVHGDYQLHL
ncbi:hypothetical protein ACNKHP_19025 [Shigella boydii]